MQQRRSSRSIRSAALATCLLAPVSVAVAQEGPAPEEEAERGLQLMTEDAIEGYTLVAPLRATSTFLIDLQGEVVHEWKSEYAPGNSVYLMEDGSILRGGRPGGNPVFSGGGEGGRVQLIAWDGTLLWDLELSSEERLAHHDIEPMPNGNVLIIAWEQVSGEDAIAAGRDPEQLGETGLWPDYVAELEPVLPDGAKIVWEWHAWDHIIQDFDPEKPNYGDVTAHPELIDVNYDHRSEPPMSAARRKELEELERQMRAIGYVGDDEDEADADDAGQARRGRRGGDWMHANSIDYHPELDLIVLSSHKMSEVFVIDHSTTTAEAAGHAGGRWGRGGDLLYRWGNPKNYGQLAAQTLFSQHDAQFIEGEVEGTVNLLVFNNGADRPGGNASSVDEIVLPLDSERGFEREEGAPFGPTELYWSYASDEGEAWFASFISGAQRLPEGNTLICSGPQGRLFEVTYDGQVAWEYLLPKLGDPPAGDGEGRPGAGGPRGRRGPGGDGPRGDRPPGDRPPGDRPDGPPPGGRRGGPGGGQGPGRGGPGQGRAGRGGGGPGGLTYGLFRATRIEPEHPGLTRLAEESR